jgi:hypothetical protein
MENTGEGNYLQSEESGRYTERISRLLRDEHTDNSALALELISGGGSNPRVLGYLFGLAVFHYRRPVADRALALLRREGGDALTLQAQKLREGAAYHYNEADFFSKYADAGFDLFDFILAAKMCNWHRSPAGRGAYFTLSHQTLNLTHYPDAVLPPSVAALDFVQYLTLPAGKNFDLDASFPYLAELPLESVFMENTRLETFPVLLFQLPRLKTLQIKRGTQRPRQPMHVPENGTYSSSSLEKLTIDSYPVEGEERLGPFPVLQEAILHRCGFHRLDFLEHSPLLEVLEAPSNQLEHVPEFLGNALQLRRLDLSQNPFREIHLDVSKLLFLEKYDLSFRRT